MMDFYASAIPAADFASMSPFGPTVDLTLAAVSDDYVFTFDGATVTQHPKAPSTTLPAAVTRIPEALARSLYAALGRLYGGYPEQSTERVLKEALEVERRRVDKILART